MGSFANSVFNMMLGWLRGAASAVWSLINGQESADAFAWLGENWLALVIVICAVCTIVDVIVHLLRWRPYKVWASFIRRVTGSDRRAARRRMEQERDEVHRQKAAVREWIYPDGTARREEFIPGEEDEVTPQPWQHLETGEELAAYRQQFARPSAQPISYRRPASLDQLQYEQLNGAHEQAAGPEGYPLPETEEDSRQEDAVQQPAADEQPAQPREPLSMQMRRRVAQLQRNLAMSEEDDMIFTYKSVKPIADVKDTYHDPVYPPDWPRNGQQDETPRRRRRKSETEPVD